MDQRNRFAAAVGTLTLLLGLLLAVTLEASRATGGDSPTWLPYSSTSPVLTRVFYDNLVMVVGFILSPLLVFAVGYHFGGQTDPHREYRSTLGALLVASVVGYGLGRTIAVVWVIGFDIVATISLVLPALVITTTRVVFVGFAGVALGYLRRSSSMEAQSIRRTSAE